MSRRVAYLIAVLAVAGGIAAYEAWRATPPPEAPAALSAGGDACERCDARQRDKARLRRLLATPDED